MKLVQLTLAALLASACTVAGAQQNPFAPPAAPTPTPVPAASAAPVAAPEPPPVKPQWEEEVRASRVGTVNGLRVYRGSNTYMFEKAKEVDVVRRLVVPSSSDSSAAPDGAPRRGSASAAPAAASQSTSAAPPKALPSMVGKPAPRK